MLAMSTECQAKQWSLKDCIDYALTNNIQLQKAKIQELTALEDVKQSQAALLPSLNLSTSQNVNYTPWPQQGRATVADGYVQSSVDKVYYNGSYSLSGNWTVWNGNKNRNNVKLNKVAAEQARLDSATTANNVLEQIAQLYVQILYSNEAIAVTKESLKTSQTNEQRGKTMVEVGKMSKADLAQLTAQRAQDEYAIVEAESNLRNYKRQLKELLQITSDEEFDVAVPSTTDDMALEAVPALNDVYAASLEQRPEIKNAKLGIESSDLGIKVAKAGRMPTVSLNAGVMTSTSSMSDNAWGTQMKNNFSLGGGVTVSIPLFDNRQTKTAINKAKLQKQSYLLDLQDKQTTLYSTIENYWLQAVTNQNKFKAARVSTESAQASYELLSEQFKQGLKNTVELMTGKTNLLQAQQNELQSKYLAILNLNMLEFYQTGNIK
ncbi:MAG: TolC family protein [Prevotella stercorea]|uniref:TolC family protein n=1 Tax=Leyella stercorea TaxID=363265 RepID=UPI0028021065|nr:TolC family protein [Leyella stercorea]MDY5552428.1 TolC family protein [Prevotella sp.]